MGRTSPSRAALAAVALALLLAGSQAHSASVALTIEEPSGVARKGWPVTSGVPLPAGALKDPTKARLIALGRELPLQTEVLAKWPDGSVKWLLLDFQMDLRPEQKAALRLDYGPRVKRAPVRDPLKLYDVAGAATVVTGPLKLELKSARPDPLGSVWLDLDRNGRFSSRERITSEQDSGIVLTDAKGATFRSDTSPAKVVIEQRGPMRACLRIEGAHAAPGGKKMFRYVARVHAYRGKPYVRVFYTFINDWPDSLMADIRSLAIDVGLSGTAGAPRCSAGGENGLHSEKRGAEALRVFQVDDRSYTVDGKAAGKRAPGWMDVSTAEFGVTAFVRSFWQNWPKGLSASGRMLSVEVCPPFEKGLYDGKPLDEDNRLYYYLHDGRYRFKVGCARTHEVWYDFHGRSRGTAECDRFAMSGAGPLLATCDPEYICATKAMGEMPPADPKKYDGYDARVEAAMKKHLDRREKLREYGMLNFGDWFGERKVNWGNLEYDLQHGLLLQYARTGDRRYYLRAEEAARHHIDVDVMHAANSHVKNPWGPAPKAGEVWLHCLHHTGGYYEYGKVKLPVSKTYFMGHSRNWGHIWIGGDIDYYLFSGDRRAREVALAVADRMIENCPTPYGTHIRAQGWPMILLLHAHSLTLDRKYLDAAGALWKVLKDNLDPEKGWVVKLAGDHCKHGDRRCHGNVPFMEGLMLSGLSRYHRITKDPEVLKAITIGIDQMIRECWEEEEDLFRYTACPLSPHWGGLIMLGVEAMDYEVRLTGNREHERILREAAVKALSEGLSGFGKSFAQRIHFAPRALGALEEH